ncbi:hypothetical protein SUGI_0451380 [Cryptomeria japonica]|nr:hypothetical protein SUGI_0451380 [Cryptomeria japonica]
MRILTRGKGPLSPSKITRDRPRRQKQNREKGREVIRDWWESERKWKQYRIKFFNAGKRIRANNQFNIWSSLCTDDRRSSFLLVQKQSGRGVVFRLNLKLVEKCVGFLFAKAALKCPYEAGEYWGDIGRLRLNALASCSFMAHVGKITVSHIKCF